MWFQCTFSLPPENIRKPYDFLMFSGLEKGCIGNEWVKKIVYWRLLHLAIHWLIMRVGFEIKGSKPKSSVNRLNLFKVLIVSSISFLKGCAIRSSDSSSSFSLSPSVITSAGCSENSEIIYSADNGRDCLVPSRTVLLGTLTKWQLLC